MDKYSKYEVRAKDLLLDVYGKMEQVELPINLSKVVDYLGLQALVFAADGEKDISGALDRGNNTIYINGDERYERQSFTLAHEIGHYLLHQDKSYDLLHRSDLQTPYENKEEEESEADAFAASLIMPRSLMRQQWKINPEISYIANMFGTSHTAAEYRLKNLGLL